MAFGKHWTIGRPLSPIIRACMIRRSLRASPRVPKPAEAQIKTQALGFLSPIADTCFQTELKYMGRDGVQEVAALCQLASFMEQQTSAT